ncbi:MAG: hypothetical protein ABSA72_09410 [Nitrososphaerales archaeon]|jgi:hypothetical protein
MSGEPVRNYTRLAAAIVIAALVIGAGIAASSYLGRAATTDDTTVSTSLSTITSTITTTASGVVTTIVTTTTSLGSNTTTLTETTTSTVTSTRVSTVTSTYQPFVAPLLQVELNATKVGYHGGLSATITLTNLLPYNMSFVPNLPANSSIAKWNGYDYLCGNSGGSDLVGFAVMKGHYTSANLSSAAPLTMEPPVNIECPASVNPDKIVFLPDSSRYAIYYPPGNSTSPSGINETLIASSHPSTGDCVLLPAGYISCDNGSLFGYWTWNGSSGPPYFNSQDANTTSKFFNYFPPGEYTLVVQDLWGATLFSYFQVAAAPS